MMSWLLTLLWLRRLGMNTLAAGAYRCAGRAASLDQARQPFPRKNSIGPEGCHKLRNGCWMHHTAALRHSDEKMRTLVFPVDGFRPLIQPSLIRRRRIAGTPS